MSAVVEALWVGAIGDYCTALAVHASGRWVAAAADGTVVMIDPQTGDERILLARTGWAVSVVAVSANWLASGGQDGVVRLWAMPGGEEIDSLVLAGWIDRLAWSRDGAYLAIGVDREVVVWSKQRVVRLQVGAVVQDLAWSPDGKLAVGVKDGVRIWHGDWGGEAQVIRLPTVVVRLGFSPDGRYLALGNQDGTLVVVDWEAIDRPWVMRGLSGKVRQLLWWGEDLVLSCGSDVVIWRLKSDLWEAQLCRIHGRSIVALAAGELLVSGGDRVCLWDRRGSLVGEMAIETTALETFGDFLGVGQADGGFGVFAMAQRV